MAQVANCPQCEHELLVPEGTVAGAWSRCPSCRAFFKLADAKLREVSAIEIVDALTEPEREVDESEHYEATQTVADISSMATWSGDAEGDLDLELSNFAKEFGQADLADADESDEVESIMSNDLEVDELNIDDVEVAEALEPESTSKESPDDAAQRIDAWFKSAKTLSDLPPITEETLAAESSLGKAKVDFLDSKYLADDEIKSVKSAPATSPANDATIDMGSDDLADLGLDDEIQINGSDDESVNLPTWDDSHHMDRLLAGLQKEPRDEFIASAYDDANDDESDELMVEESEAEAPVAAEEWAPAESMPIASPAAAPRPKKSMVRMLLMTALGGVMAVPLAGYALLWLGGPQADFFGVANYLPKAMLPGSFTKPQFAAGPATRLPAPETPVEPSTDTPAQPESTPAEKQASFTEPADAKKVETPTDDLNAGAAAPEKPAAEPAEFNAPPAAPMKENVALSEPVKIQDAPSFKAADLAAALQMGKEAEANLVNGSMSDGAEVARAKGTSYAKLADLAQKAAFVDANAEPEESAKLEQEADGLFRSVFASAHTREEVGQIVPMWIASPKRTHGGVFFAGSVVAHDAKGTVSECSIDVGSGQPMPVLIPAAMGAQLKGSNSPVVVVGSLVEDPAKKVEGYTGNAPQAVFATKLIPLE